MPAGAEYAADTTPVESANISEATMMMMSSPSSPPSCPLRGEKFSPSAREMLQGRDPESGRWSG